MEWITQINWAILTSSVLLIIFLVGIISLLMYVGIHTVPQGEEYTIERFGKYVRTLQPGLRFVFPFIERISNKVDIREQVMDVPRQEIITQDNASINVDGIIFYMVFDSHGATYQIKNLNEALEHFTITHIRTVMGSMDLNDILSKREDINKKLFKDLDSITEPWGVRIKRIELKDITPAKNIIEAMEKQVKAQRDKKAAILEAEGQKKAAIEKAEGEKRAKVLQAEAEKEAEILKAKSYQEAEMLKANTRKNVDILNAEARKEIAFNEAEARERAAAAEAKATEMVSESLKNGDIQALNYFIAQRYVEALQNIAGADNQRLIMMPLEASNLISSISGITEIAKAIQDKSWTTKSNL